MTTYLQFDKILVVASSRVDGNDHLRMRAHAKPVCIIVYVENCRQE